MARTGLRTWCLGRGQERVEEACIYLGGGGNLWTLAWPVPLSPLSFSWGSGFQTEIVSELLEEGNPERECRLSLRLLGAPMFALALVRARRGHSLGTGFPHQSSKSIFKGALGPGPLGRGEPHPGAELGRELGSHLPAVSHLGFSRFWVRLATYTPYSLGGQEGVEDTLWGPGWSWQDRIQMGTALTSCVTLSSSLTFSEPTSPR